jgi:hypothetical protein
MMATYLAQRRESFAVDLVHLHRMRLGVTGVSILTKRKQKSEDDVFNYSGIHSLFVIVAKLSYSIDHIKQEVSDASF